MTNAASLLRASAHPMNTNGVTATVPTRRYRPEKCEFPIHVGLFFDGTGNNQDWAEPGTSGTHLERQKDSNVARLFRTYKDERLEGYYRYYIPGVGTPFDEIGEEGSSSLGMGFGAGGDARIVFGLLSVLNAIHSAIDRRARPMIDGDGVKALCRNGWLPLQTGTEGNPNRLPPADQFALEKVGMKDQGGLLTINGTTYRTKFLKAQFAQLAQKISDTRHPKLVEVFIDVFGFSRGAAQARVFCNWLDDCFEGDTLAGVTTHIRFLGIFDTVAAVGLGPAAGRWAHGHYAWGDTRNLRISPRVRHCEHYVAMHEQRESFPLEDVQMPGDAMPSHCRQFRFPGMHSDVGGGYLPDEQGRNGGSEDSKLSQIPLNRMYEAARAAHVPLDMELAQKNTNGRDPYALSKRLKADYLAFIQTNGAGVREIADCLIDILAWRYRYRDDYTSQPFLKRTHEKAQADLRDAHNIFLKDIREISRAHSDVHFAKMKVETAGTSLSGTIFRLAKAEEEHQDALNQLGELDRERLQIYRLIRERRLGSIELTFLGEYCHDSYAGFKPFAVLRTPLMRNAPWESGGYLKFRTRFAGENLRLATLESGTTAST